MLWHSPKQHSFRISGFAWLEEEGIYRRLPVSPRVPIRAEVDALANCTAGGQIRFQTNSRKLSIRVRLDGTADMYHMPATGQCGFDCYIEKDGQSTYYSTSRYDHTQREYESVLIDRPNRDMSNVTIHFPLYRGVEHIELGLDADAVILAAPSYASRKRVIIYGTSITQGGCASRPGMAYSNIMSRYIPLEFINLGFSGNGLGEPELAELISDIANPAVLILDYEANCPSEEWLRQTLPEFIRIYRNKHPEIPILVASRIRYAKESFQPELLAKRLAKKEIQIETVERLRKAGDERIFFLDGSDFLGDRHEECTVDGVHPTDLGFIRMADRFTPVVRELLHNFGVLEQG